jgi:hypothetical protein
LNLILGPYIIGQFFLTPYLMSWQSEQTKSTC